MYAFRAFRSEFLKNANNGGTNRFLYIRRFRSIDRTSYIERSRTTPVRVRRVIDDRSFGNNASGIRRFRPVFGKIWNTGFGRVPRRRRLDAEKSLGTYFCSFAVCRSFAESRIRNAENRRNEIKPNQPYRTSHSAGLVSAVYNRNRQFTTGKHAGA